MGCGTVTSTGSSNAAPLVVDGFPCATGGASGQVNRANTGYVSVRICAPGSTTNCQIVDHVLLDTGSSGLRIAAAALQSSLQPSSSGLPVLTAGAGSAQVTECVTYVSSYSYGPIVGADVYIAGKQATGTQLHVFGAPGYTAPRACSSQGGSPTDTPAALGGNGVLGVGFETLDAYSLYYDCPASSHTNCVTDSTYAGVPNVVAQFAGDNNGVALSLPAVASTGASTPVVGTLYFGVGTQSNNTPSGSTFSLANDPNILTTSGAQNPNYLTFAAMLNGGWTTAYLDSGTDAVYFVDSAIAACSSSNTYYGYFCPGSPVSLAFSLANTGTTANGQSTVHTLNYSLVDPNTVGYDFSTLAVSNVGGPASSSSTLTDTTFAFGLSAFFGHTVYVLFSGMTAAGTVLTGTGPINGYD